MRKSIGKITTILLTFTFLLLASPVHAIVDPFSVPNNKFGIHIISPTHDEASPAAQLVNSAGGDWGYITVLIESKNRDKEKWQSFFDDLRRRHLIPLVRIATQPEGNFWQVPTEEEADKWATFLDSLNWPTQNRYVIIYNEPNQGQEWAGQVNPRSYAHILDQTITALKNKNPDFFVLNAGFDASAPEKFPLYKDEANFLIEVNDERPGIFNRLDGWVSHSYPNPGFAGSPQAFGKGTVRTWIWELNFLKTLGVSKDLPIFITETGWKHAEGLNFDKSLPSSDVVGSYYQNAFQNAWNDQRIVAVTPFLLTYPAAPFDHFSFKKPTSEPQDLKILGVSFPDYYPQYQSLMDLPKTSGQPIQKKLAQLVRGSIYKTLVAGESYIIPLTLKNTGQSIWGEENIELRILQGQKELGINVQPYPANKKVEPGGEITFNLTLKAPEGGHFQTVLQLYHNKKPFDSEPLKFETDVKAPVILQIKTSLLNKRNAAGSYLLTIINEAFKSNVEVDLDNQGQSSPLESRYLLPDYNFTFTLHKPFYKPKTINYQVVSGVNQLNFGTLEPDYFAALFKPRELWQLLPFSN